jgi:anion-transporting  ArsA/GET3 family ATPase
VTITLPFPHSNRTGTARFRIHRSPLGALVPLALARLAVSEPPVARLRLEPGGNVKDQPARTLEPRRLVIVTGKGGTGKTTVTAALALGAAARGQRVLVAAVDRDARLPTLLSPRPAPLAYQPALARENVWVCHIEPFEALGEYLGLQLGTRRLVDPVLRQRGFRQLLLASPGWRELITLGKVWHFEQMRERGRPIYDLIVVDAPATGHSLTFLDVPRVVVSAVRAGPLRHHTERVEALIEDRSRTLLLPVALAEELPARETVELIARARSELGVAIDCVVVNAVHEPPYPDDLADLDARLAALPDDTDLGALPPPPARAACGAVLRARAALNRHHTRAIAQETGLPTVTLPYLRDGLRGPDDTARLAEPLYAGLGAAA